MLQPPRAAAHARWGVLVLALVAWSSTLVRGGFAYDDREALVGNPIVEGSLPWSAAFLRDYWHHQGVAGHWRPIATLSLTFDHAWSGLEPFGYHLTNVLLHVAVVALAAWILARLPRCGATHAALALFAVHPACADVVAWISGRSASLSALGGLLALGAILKVERPLPSALAVGAGLFVAVASREDGVVFAPLCVLLAATRSRAQAGAALLGCVLALAAAGWLRWLALGEVVPSAPHAPLADAALLERLTIGGRALARALLLAAAPLPHAPSVAPALVAATGPLALALGAWLVWGAAAAGGSLLLVRGTNPERRLVGASAAAAALAYTAHLQLVPSGELFAPRFLYLPSLLLLPCLARALVSVPRSVLVALVALGLLGAWIQSGVYASRASYWQAVARHTPLDVRAWNALGNAAREEGRREAARSAYAHAARLDPDYSRPWTGLGTLALEDGDLERALELLREAARRGPENPRAFGNLGVLHLRRGEPEAAAAAYARALELGPGMVALWRGLARALAELERVDEARAALARALALDPNDGSSRALLERLEHAATR